MMNASKSLVHVLNVNRNTFSTLPSQKLFSIFYERFYMSKIYHVIIVALALLLLFSCSPTQFGKIYTSSQANELFGNVIFSTGIPLDTVATILEKTEKNIMFGIIKQKVIVLG